MSLRQLAAADNRRIVENTSEFGWPITVTNPDGLSRDLVGLSSDVSLMIDPETGQAVSGRKAHVSINLGSIAEAGLGMPVAKPEGEPWLVRFNDIAGAARTFKVIEVIPDRAIGLVICALGAWRSDPA